MFDPVSVDLVGISQKNKNMLRHPVVSKKLLKIKNTQYADEKTVQLAQLHSFFENCAICNFLHQCTRVFLILHSLLEAIRGFIFRENRETIFTQI